MLLANINWFNIAGVAMHTIRWIVSSIQNIAEVYGNQMKHVSLSML
jgi:hypothetical protein